MTGFRMTLQETVQHIAFECVAAPDIGRISADIDRDPHCLTARFRHGFANAGDRSIVQPVGGRQIKACLPQVFRDRT